MIRQHQFEKVELVSITHAGGIRGRARAHDRLRRGGAEALDLPFRTVCSAPATWASARAETYDLEVWLPGQDATARLAPARTCGDFQARRMDARSRPADDKATRFVHTLNGSGLAVGRTLVALMENYQEADGRSRSPRRSALPGRADAHRGKQALPVARMCRSARERARLGASRGEGRVMRILLTNDDGIHAAGLAARSGSRASSPTTSARRAGRRAIRRRPSLSLSDPLRLREIGERRFRGQGHADRLRHAGRAQAHGGPAPDLVLSGVNRGHNVAEDVTYSGTIAGAIEGRCWACRRSRCRRPMAACPAGPSIDGRPRDPRRPAHPQDSGGRHAARRAH